MVSATKGASMSRKVNHLTSDRLRAGARGDDQHAVHCRKRLAAGRVSRVVTDSSVKAVALFAGFVDVGAKVKGVSVAVDDRLRHTAVRAILTPLGSRSPHNGRARVA